MKVVVDTVIWSLALRRSEPHPEVWCVLTELIEDQRVVLLGPVRQEVLSGYSDRRQFNRLRQRLEAFENEPVSDEDYVRAAEYHNLCRKKGIQGAHTDFLICSCSVRLKSAIYTCDRDFEQYADVLPVTLYRE